MKRSIDMLELKALLGLADMQMSGVSVRLNGEPIAGNSVISFHAEDTYRIAYASTSGRHLGYLRWNAESAQHITSGNLSNASAFSKEDAERLASDFTDYWSTKGRQMIAHAERIADDE